MLLTRFWRAAVAAAALSAPVAAQDKEAPNGQSTFISPGGDLSFAFTVPDNGNTDVFFTMRAHIDNSWAAVGLGSDDMKGALFLMMYRNDYGDNVTFSPRLAYGNYEPQHYPELRYEALPGTGVVDDYMVLVVKCIEHCRSWPAADSNSGYIDVSSPNQKAVYALGPKEAFGSSSPAADLKFHREFGVFTIDMKRTQGSPDAPVLDSKSKAVGTSLDYRKTPRSDFKAGLHGAFMIFFVVILFPLGVVLLRFGRWARWHGVNQAVGVAGALAGLALGVLTSFNYQRSRGFRSHHQILGFVVVGFILGQFTLGVLHHQKFRKTQTPTRFGMAHTWLGRIILFLGTLNAFFGFTFALNRRLGMVLAGLIILGFFGVLFLSVGRRYFFKNRASGTAGPLGGAPTGYQPQPWREGQHGPPGAGYPSEPPPGYDAPSQQIGLQSVSHPPAAPSPWKSSDAKDYEDHPALGSAQRPREFA